MYYINTANSHFILCWTLFLKALICFEEELHNLVTFSTISLIYVVITWQNLVLLGF